jgi:hypothetical protein
MADEMTGAVILTAKLSLLLLIQRYLLALSYSAYSLFFFGCCLLCFDVVFWVDRISYLSDRSSLN